MARRRLPLSEILQDADYGIFYAVVHEMVETWQSYFNVIHGFSGMMARQPVSPVPGIELEPLMARITEFHERFAVYPARLTCVFWSDNCDDDEAIRDSASQARAEAANRERWKPYDINALVEFVAGISRRVMPGVFLLDDLLATLQSLLAALPESGDYDLNIIELRRSMDMFLTMLPITRGRLLLSLDPAHVPAQLWWTR